MSNVDIGRYSKRLVQMIWDPEPKNDDVDHASIWCLGLQYNSQTRHVDTTSDNLPENHFNPQPASAARLPLLQRTIASSGVQHAEKVNTTAAVHETGEDWPADFLDDFESRIWLTYRSNFVPIPKPEDPKALSNMSFSVRLKNQLSSQEGFTSDAGWGCMIRSGQCLLANALAVLRLGRGYRNGRNSAEEKQLLSLFADDPKAPFSIHRFVEHGAMACGTYPGQWFGPSATAKCIHHEGANLKVYVTGDGPDVFEDTFMSIAKGSYGQFRPTLLLVGTRLGIDRVTPAYWNALRSSLMMPQSVGIAGGRPSSSHYFIGVQSNNFFYLDPHQTRTALPFHENATDYTPEEVDSCHTRRLRRLPIEDMDPSMLIAFLFRNEDDWKDWRTNVNQTHGKHIFHVADFQPSSSGRGVEREAAVDEVKTLDDDQEMDPDIQ